jgi:3alpha(or 20beta)-hydroxysteroid dehydrogenase
MGRLEGKVALITGAARGQGAAEARLFAQEGASVVLCDLLEEEGQETARAIGDAALFVRHDVAEEDDWANAIARAVERFGRLDVLVNNAGILRRSPLATATREDFELHFRVMQLGAFLGMRAVLEPMRDAGGGAIVNISSTNAVTGSPDSIAYTAAKWALRGMSRCAALELAPLGIRVNTIIPGMIDTPMIAGNTPDHNAAVHRRIPLHRAGLPQEVARTALFLVCSDSSYTTGAEFKVDGGLTI